MPSADFLLGPVSQETERPSQDGTPGPVTRETLEKQTPLQQRLKSHLKHFHREAEVLRSSAEIHLDKPQKSDEEICKDLRSKEALEMRSFRGSEIWLTHIAATLGGTQILPPKWDACEMAAADVEHVQESEMDTPTSVQQQDDETASPAVPSNRGDLVASRPEADAEKPETNTTKARQFHFNMFALLQLVPI